MYTDVICGISRRDSQMIHRFNHRWQTKFTGALTSIHQSKSEKLL